MVVKTSRGEETGCVIKSRFISIGGGQLKRAYMVEGLGRKMRE
jgi:hypothetical protein